MFLADFHKKHLHQDIYVLGSGATLDYIDPEFFWDRIIVATNSVADRLALYQNATVYTHSHYHKQDTAELRVKYPFHWFFCPEGDRGYAGQPSYDADNVVFYKHQPTRYDFDPDTAWHDEGLIVGSSSLHGSMHLAAYMGASNIILAGADCGILDGKANHGTYQSGDLVVNDQLEWLRRWDRHLIAVKRKLVQKYGVRVYSLNPFVNMNLEGHTWVG